MEKVLYTPEQLQAWKNQHGENALRQVSFEDNDEIQQTAVIRKPTRKDIAAFSAIAQKDNDKGLVVLVKNCMLTSSIDDIFEQDKADCFFAVAKAIQELIAVRNEEVKNL